MTSETHRGRGFRVPPPSIHHLIRVELESCRGPDGRIKARDVIDHAKPEESLLHKYFTWDDRIAAENWRLHEARALMRIVKVDVITTTEKVVTVKAFVRDPTAGNDRPGYITFDDVLANERTTKLALHTEWIRFAGALKRALTFTRACEMEAYVNENIADMDDFDMVVRNIEALRTPALDPDDDEEEDPTLS